MATTPHETINLIVCQDAREIHAHARDVIKELDKDGHHVELACVDHVNQVIELLDERHRDQHPLPTDIIMDVSGGNGAEGAKKVIAWFEKNSPGAPLPSFNFLSLSIDMAIDAAVKLRINDGRILAGAVSEDELGWVKNHVEGTDPDGKPPSTNALRRLLNDRLGLSLPLAQTDDSYTSDRLKKLHALANDGVASEWVRGRMTAEELIERMRPFPAAFIGHLEGGADSASRIDSNLRADASFYGATGLPQKGRAAFTIRDIEVSYQKDFILFMRSYDPSVVPLLASGKLSGLVVASTFMASHLKLLCDTHGVTGLFGVAPKGQRTMHEEFNEEAQPHAPPYFSEDTVKISGREVRLGQYVLVGVDGNGLMFDPPDELKTTKPKAQKIDDSEQFKAQTMERCFAQFFAERGLPAHGVKVNVDTAYRLPDAGIGLVRTEQMIATDIGLFRGIKDILLTGDENAYSIFSRESGYRYKGFIKHLSSRPVKIRLFDFTHSEILSKDEQKAFLEKYPRMDIHGIDALHTWPRLYREQVGSIFKQLAAAGLAAHPLEIMMPALRTEQDVLEVKRLVEQEAANAGVNPDQYSFGTMVETLEACENIEAIAQHCEFISFGTNDLTQQHTGMSRGDLKAHARFARLNGYDPFKVLSPEVFDIVRDTLQKGRQANPSLKVDVCGAQAADIETAVKLFDAGVDNVSVAPTPANIHGLPLSLNYRRYDAWKKQQATPRLLAAGWSAANMAMPA